jgi:hypothetical protein
MAGLTELDKAKRVHSLKYAAHHGAAIGRADEDRR